MAREMATRSDFSTVSEFQLPPGVGLYEIYSGIAELLPSSYHTESSAFRLQIKNSHVLVELK